MIVELTAHLDGARYADSNVFLLKDEEVVVEEGTNETRLEISLKKDEEKSTCVRVRGVRVLIFENVRVVI